MRQDDNQELENITSENDLELVYGLNDRPPVPQAFFAGLQHVLASVVGIVTPPIIITNALGLGIEDATYIISMSLLISGIATFIQVRAYKGIGSGLLSVQGTSFAFLGPILGSAMIIKADLGVESALATIFGCVIAGAFIEIFISRFLHLAKQIFSPIVTGVVVTLIGLTLIQVGVISMAGGYYVKENVPDSFASTQNLAVALLVLVAIVVLNLSRNQYLRMSSVAIGLFVGYVAALALGMVNFSGVNDLQAVVIPVPLKYGLDFSVSAFIAIGMVYVITAIESAGDITATSKLSGRPVKGDDYVKTIKGGILADGINSVIAGIFNTFPNSTFSQNNGVIQLTGVASRYVGIFIAGILIVLGLSPFVVGVFRTIPEPVLGGATVLMFGTVAATGIKIISSEVLNSRAVLIIAISFGLGLGVQMVPEVLSNITNTEIKNILSSGVTTGGLSAIVLNILLPEHSKTFAK
ncbi:MAG: purine permease [Acidiferrobacterales bacterium]|nr:purine permease [Acidiferrobacterales bacterium]